MRLLTLPALVALILGLQFTAPRPALADWQMTRWGMSEAEVRDSVPDVRENMDRGQDFIHVRASLVAPYKAFDIDFAVYFYFLSTGLVQVSLQPSDPANCPYLPAWLDATYGPPERTDRFATMERTTWFDRDRGNSVELQLITAAMCSILYKRIPVTGEATGL